MQWAPWAGAVGAPFRALCLRGTGLQGTRRGSLRDPPLARAPVCVSLWKLCRGRGRGRDAGTTCEPLLTPVPGSPQFSEVGGFPAHHCALALSIFALPVPGGAAEPGLWLFRLGNPGWPGWAA